MIRNIRIHLLFFLAAILPSCGGEDTEGAFPSPGEGETVTASFRLGFTSGGQPATKAMTDEQEHRIGNLAILAFKVNDNGSEQLQYIWKERNLKDGKTSVTAKIRIEPYPQRFVLIANAIDRIDLLSAGGQEKASVMAGLRITGDSPWNLAKAEDNLPIPMWGESDPIAPESPGGTIDVGMIRMLARIDINVTTPDFNLTKLYLYNPQQSGCIAPATASWDAGGKEAKLPTIPAGGTKLHNKAYPITSSGTQDATLYTFEAPAATGDEATCLVFGGKVNDEDEKYYRMDFLDADKTPIPLLRNNKYTVQITKIPTNGYSTPDDAFQPIDGIDLGDFYVTKKDVINVEGGSVQGTYEQAQRTCAELKPGNWALPSAEQMHIIYDELISNNNEDYGFRHGYYWIFPLAKEDGKDCNCFTISSPNKQLSIGTSCYIRCVRTKISPR